MALLASLHSYWSFFDWDIFDELKHGLTLAVHLAFAYFVYRDAQRRPWLLLNAPAWLWALAVVLTGVWGVAIYWLGNYFRGDAGRRFDEPQPTTGNPSPGPVL